jgi:potassium-transporting ATPase KdpC subunit
MRTHLYRSVVLSVVLLVICGVGYNVAGWALSQAAFHSQANGSITANGSTLIGQPWGIGTAINPKWFNGRPDPDNPLELNGVAGESGASNLGPKSSALVQDVKTLIAEWHAVGVDPTPDLVTSSGSGLDPDISAQDALVQVPMVAAARGIPASSLRALIAAHTTGAQFGFLGSSYVNVLQLNEALAALVAARP